MKKLLIWGVSLTIVSPILGLAGTVIGMVNSFSTLKESAGAEKAEVLAHNISIALYSQVAGLFFFLIGIGLLMTYLVKYIKNKNNAKNTNQETPQVCAEVQDFGGNINKEITTIKSRKISIKAILIGFTVGLIAALISVVIFVFLYIGVHLSNGGHLDELAPLSEEPYWLVLSLFIGHLLNLLSGFITGRIAKNNELLNAALTGILVVIFDIYFYVPNPLWYNVLYYALVIPMVILGGVIARRTNYKLTIVPPENAPEEESSQEI